VLVASSELEHGDEHQRQRVPIRGGGVKRERTEGRKCPERREEGLMIDVTFSGLSVSSRPQDINRTNNAWL
jgi:hypothetical protein